MRPPLLPGDPSFGAYNHANIYRCGHDSLMHPDNAASPYLPQGQPLLGTPGNPSDQADNFQLPSIRGTDSLTRWENDTSDPWTPPMNQGSAPIFGERTPSGQMYRHYREPSRSEVSASTNSRYRLDSGYGGSRDMNSDLSADHPDQSQGGQSVAGNLDDFHVGGDSNSYPDNTQEDQYSSLDGMSDTSSRQPRTSGPLTCDFDETCTHISKNRSEHK